MFRAAPGGRLPRIKSAKKAMRQARSRTGRNRAQRSALRTALKRVREATGAAAAQAYGIAVRLLDRAAARGGLECPAPSLPDEASVIEVISLASDTPASERALAFGGEQLLLQHRALLDLLEARAEARGDF